MRPLLALSAALLVLAAYPTASGAALTFGADAPGLGFPASVTDSVGGVSLTSCQDNSGFCIETPALEVAPYGVSALP